MKNNFFENSNLKFDFKINSNNIALFISSYFFHVHIHNLYIKFL